MYLSIYVYTLYLYIYNMEYVYVRVRVCIFLDGFHGQFFHRAAALPLTPLTRDKKGRGMSRQAEEMPGANQT